MWLRFTDKARLVIFYAQEEAMQPEVRPEHLLLGLLRDEDMHSFRLLREFRCPIATMRETIHTQWPPVRISGRFDYRLSDAGKEMLDRAAAESRSLGHRHIGTEHLLLGVMGLEYPLVQETFASCDISLQTLRERITSFIPPEKNLSIREKFAEFGRFLSRKRR